ncbi:MAG: hypothetical protein PHE49_10150 [bacterium]|nr:hypothetical protein [bacterium]
MKSQIFYTDVYKSLEDKIKTFLNAQPDFLSKYTVGSTRAIGDAIQRILEDNFQNIIGKLAKEYSANFARRAMADLAFTDQNGLYYVVDVKTHSLDTKFNMPNLTSVERLARFYQEDTNCYVILMVEYIIKGINIQVEKVHFIPIEFLAWDCLTLGALGWGQIQIANANNIIIASCSRKEWMLKLCNELFEFYPGEIQKTKDRIEYFEQVRNLWKTKKDIWE